MRPQVLAVEAEVHGAVDGEEGRGGDRPGAPRDRAEGVGVRVVRRDVQGVGPGLLEAEGALDADGGVREGDLPGVEADEPGGGGVPAVVGGRLHAPVELFVLVGVEQQAREPHGGPGEDVGVQGGGHQVLPGDAEGGDDLAPGEVGGASGDRQVDAGGSDAVLGGRAVGEEPRGFAAGDGSAGASRTTVVRRGSARWSTGGRYGLRTPR